jgi:tetratricopeptide (TPR) repeat protein
VQKPAEETLAEAAEHHREGAAALADGQFDEALGHLGTARDLYSSLGRDEDVASESLYIGLAAEAAGRLDDAEADYLRALEQYRRIGANVELAGVLERLGDLARTRGERERALSLYGEAAQLLESLGASREVRRLERSVAAVQESHPSDDEGPRLGFIARDAAQLSAAMDVVQGVVGQSSPWASFMFTFAHEDVVGHFEGSRAGDTMIYVLPDERSALVAAQVLKDLRAIEASGARPILLVLAHQTLPAELASFEVARIASLEGLADYMLALEPMPPVDLDSLTPRAFEGLVADLLTELGFEVELGASDRGVDLVATLTRADPFGMEERTVWLVEAKATRAPPGLRALHQLVGAMAANDHVDRGLFVTTTEMTSVAREWLAQSPLATRVRVLEAPDLRNLLFRHPRILRMWLRSFD